MTLADTHRHHLVGDTGELPDGSRSRRVTLRVVAVDDHRTLAELLEVAMRDEPDVEFIGHASTAADGFELIGRTRPDVVLMDMGLPDLDGVRATAQVVSSYPEIRVVMLTGVTDPHVVAQAAAAGASAFVPKSGGLTEVLSAVRNARKGAMVVDSGLLAGILDAPRPRGGNAPSLTPREKEVLTLLGLGLDVRSASRRLGISLHTCRGHVKSLLAKLDCHSQLEAVVAATRMGLLEMPTVR